MTRPNWRDIPMPRAVATLPRTASGMPVPYVTYYESPDGEDYSEVTVLANTGARLLDCRCTFGQGRPKIGKQCLHRQRKAVAERRCNVCGRRMSRKAELIFMGAATTNTQQHGPGTPFSQESPTHHDCAVYSALACPRMANNLSDVTLAITRDYDVYARTTWYGPNGKTTSMVPLDQLGSVPQVADLYVAVLNPVRTRLVTLDQWLATEARDLNRSSVRGRSQ